MVAQIAWSKLDIINLAMNSLGKRSVNDLMNSGEFADSAERAFDMLFPTEISKYDWRFATKIQPLSQLLIPPLDPYYMYAYEMPGDYLALRRLFPLTAFQLYEDQLWCNVGVTTGQTLNMEYRFLPEVTKLPSYFVNFFCILLAEWFARSVAEDSNLADNLRKKIIIERGNAMFVDGQSRPTTRLFQNPIIDARFNYYIGDIRGSGGA